MGEIVLIAEAERGRPAGGDSRRQVIELVAPV